MANGGTHVAFLCGTSAHRKAILFPRVGVIVCDVHSSHQGAIHRWNFESMATDVSCIQRCPGSACGIGRGVWPRSFRAALGPAQHPYIPYAGTGWRRRDLSRRLCYGLGAQCFTARFAYLAINPVTLFGPWHFPRRNVVHKPSDDPFA
ncbi:hypothetical protein BDZ89DRAFT_1059486 [Hymenopellis radicata]|nr:hypothetical protein BDZ89DRAFT_1059486 [Hymenopellis radicata]